MPNSTPLVATIVLNWNSKTDTLACLASLESSQGVGMEVILVDNASIDDTVHAVQKGFSQVTVIENPSNLGYADGNNVGIRHALGQGVDYVFVVNNDTVLAPDCLSILVSDLENNLQAAAAGPKILYYDAPEILNFAGGGLSDQGLTYHIGVHQPDGPIYSHSQETSWLTGCAILFRVSALRRVGLFETKYYLLYEDADWSLRAKRSGYSLRWVADAVLWHKESASFGRTWSPAYVYYFSRNRFLFLEKNYPKRSLPRLHRYALNNLFHLVRTEISPQGGGNEPFWRAVVWRGFADYLLRRFGARTYTWRRS